METSSFAAQLINLAIIRHFVEKVAHDLNADQAAIDDIVQAVDEAATNIIVHGYAESTGMIEIGVGRDQDHLMVCLRDQAPCYDPRQIPAPDLTLPLEDRKPGGLGVYLIHRFTDEVRYRAIPQGGNELVLVKRISRK